MQQTQTQTHSPPSSAANVAEDGDAATGDSRIKMIRSASARGSGSSHFWKSPWIALSRQKSNRTSATSSTAPNSSEIMPIDNVLPLLPHQKQQAQMMQLIQAQPQHQQSKVLNAMYSRIQDVATDVYPKTDSNSTPPSSSAVAAGSVALAAELHSKPALLSNPCVTLPVAKANDNLDLSVVSTENLSMHPVNKGSWNDDADEDTHVDEGRFSNEKWSSSAKKTPSDTHKEYEEIQNENLAKKIDFDSLEGQEIDPFDKDTGHLSGPVNPMFHIMTAGLSNADSRDTLTGPITSGDSQSIDQYFDFRHDQNLTGDSSTVIFTGASVADEDGENDDDDVESVASLVENNISTTSEDNPPLTTEQKLQIAFDLPSIEQYKGEFACWMIKSMLLKGYMYLTENHLCFWASLPSRMQGIFIKSGFLAHRPLESPTIRTYNSHWFVLKDDVLNFYENSTELYYPLGGIHLRNATSVERSKSRELGFKIIVKSKKFHLQADTETALQEWMKAIKASIFRAKNEGDDVRIVLPYNCIKTVEHNKTFSLTDTVRVRVVDEDMLVTEDYFFSYFNDISGAVSKITQIWNEHTNSVLGPHSSSKKSLSKEISVKSLKRCSLYDSTFMSVTKIQHSGESVVDAAVATIPTIAPAAATTPLSYTTKPPLHSLNSSPVRPLKTVHSFFAANRTTSPMQDLALSGSAFVSFPPPVANTNTSAGATTVSSPDVNSSVNSASPVLPVTAVAVAVTDSIPSRISDITAKSEPAFSGSQGTSMSSESILSDSEKTVQSPPASPLKHAFQWFAWPAAQGSPVESTSEDASLSTSGIDSRTSTATLAAESSEGGAGVSTLTTYSPQRGSPTKGWGWSGRVQHRKSLSDCSGISISVPTPRQIKDFQTLFPLPGKEELLACYTCYLIRTIPRLGSIYVAENYICFKSKLTGIRTTVIVPISDVTHVERAKGSYGLSVLTKDQNEIFFEFYSTESRNRSHALLSQKINQSRLGAPADERARMTEQMKRNVSVLEDIHRADNHFVPDFRQTNLPWVVSEDYIIPSSNPTPMHITCLTIGTRGDVQPYIALCKGLKKAGHTPRIATHLEYQPWIESHGIEFREVKGNPAELMKLCVEYGMFTARFFREAVAKLTPWAEELFSSAWTACQGTQLLIESPSAMAGLHIAEALDIPFFGAFPMPWSRTKAYPHPFAVPETNLGATYNYTSHVLVEQVFWRFASGFVNRFRKNILNLPPISLGNLNEHKIPYLYSFSPHVVPPPSDWNDWIHTTGYWFLDNPDLDWEAPESLLSFLNGNGDDQNQQQPPVVYIGFGSIVVSDPDEMTRTIIEGVRKAGVRAIVSKGWSGRLRKDAEVELQIPDFIYMIEKCPHDWLFPKVAGVVHHGGAGTTAAGIRAGVPTVIRPYFGDQFLWADRVQDLGVGCSIRKLTASKLAWALTCVTKDERMKERARVLGEKVRAENGVERAIHYINRDLEFARLRIKKLQHYEK